MQKNGIYVKNILRSDLPRQIIFPRDINHEFPGCVSICDWIDMFDVRRSILDLIFSGLCLDKEHIPLNIRDLKDIRNSFLLSGQRPVLTNDINNLKYLIRFMKHCKDPAVQVYFYDIIEE